MREPDKIEEERYREALDDFEIWLASINLPEDFSDWTILDWQMFALMYLQQNWKPS